MLAMAYSATHLEARARPSTSPSSGMPIQKASHDRRSFFAPSQMYANRRYASNRKPPTYVSFMAMRDWAKNIPSTHEKRATSRPTERRRKRSRASR